MFQEAIRKYNEQATQPFTPKVVLFDMDGVLYDSMPNHAKAWQRAMAEFGIHFTAEDSYATRRDSEGRVPYGDMQRNS